MSKYSQLKKELQLKNKQVSASNTTHININIANSDEIISPYAEDNKVVINSEFANFLENSVKDISPKQDISIYVTSPNHDIETISAAIKNYYNNEFMDTERKLKHNLSFSIITLLIGLIALSINIILSSLNTPVIIGNAIDIFGWVFVWEAVDVFFFRRAELKFKQYREINFINAKIISK